LVTPEHIHLACTSTKRYSPPWPVKSEPLPKHEEKTVQQPPFERMAKTRAHRCGQRQKEKLQAKANRTGAESSTDVVYNRTGAGSSTDIVYQ